MRYLPHNDKTRAEMLKTIGVKSIEDLFADVPKAVRQNVPLSLPPHRGEMEVERALSDMAEKSLHAGKAAFFLGGGAYRHHIPASVDHIIQRSEFLTSYTPYQPEITQGTLQYLFEFQTQTARIMDMDVANASMYDGSTACAEAVLMAHRITRRGKTILSARLHPHYAETVRNQTQFASLTILQPALSLEGEEDLLGLIDDDVSAIVVQNPDFFGNIRDFSKLAKTLHEKNILLIGVTTEIIALGLIKPFGTMGADIAVAEGQSLGNGLSFGGPYIGLFACREKYIRQMPGRICGQTVDEEGRRGFVLTLSTREQHIRREKATSNICTNSGLCSLAFTIHLALLGEEGYKRLARINHANACRLAERVASIKGVSCLTNAFFNEICIALPKPAAQIIEALADKNILGGIPVSRLLPNEPSMENLLLLAATEMNSDEDIDALHAALVEVLA